MQALTRRGALYSQGGYLAGDPIDPATGTYYPRTGPNSFDCSGLIWWAYAQAGVNIGATTYQQINNGVRIPCTLANLNGASTTCWALGDLIFLQYSGGQHVAIYVGNGLFMDCYNHATGCILHDVSSDSFYQAHFAQARRIVSGCEGFANNPGTPTSPGGGDAPALDDAFSVQAPTDWASLPDLIGYVSYTVPQCNSCTDPPSGLQPIPEPEGNAGNWLDIGSWISWLGIRIQNIIINLICWLLMLFQLLVNFLAGLANAFIFGLNQLWRFALFAWLTLKAWLYAGFVLFEIIRAGIASALDLLTIIGYFLTVLLALAGAALALAGQLVALIAQLGGALLGLIGWIGGLMLALIANILLAFQGTGAPPQISGATDHVVYRFTRGILDGLLDGDLSWIFWLGIAMAYISFFAWVARYLPKSEAE